MTKVCSACKRELPPSLFNKDKHKADGLTCRCIECRRPQNRDWIARKRIENPKYGNEWAKQNPEKMRAILARFEARNPGRRQKWFDEHPFERRAMLQRARYKRRALKKNAGPSIGAKVIKDILDLQRGRCIGCRRKIARCYTVDHIVPLSAGGDNSRENIQLLCKSCNSSKGARPQRVFLAARGFLI